MSKQLDAVEGGPKMLLAWLVQLMQSPVGQSVIGFSASYAAENILDGLREKMKDDSIEYQMLRCMDMALEKLCSIHKNPDWEYDSTAMCSTFIKGINDWDKVYTHDGLTKTLSDALGHDVTDEDLTSWISFFHQQIAKSENSELRNYLCTMKLFDISGTAQSDSYRPPALLTAKVSIWERELFGRDTILETLHNAIRSGSRHIQLTGMGGIGKTEILYKLYTHYSDASNREETVDYIAFLSYRGSMDQSVHQLDFQSSNTQDTDSYWEFLRACGERGKQSSAVKVLISKLYECDRIELGLFYAIYYDLKSRDQTDKVKFRMAIMEHILREAKKDIPE